MHVRYFPNRCGKLNLSLVLLTAPVTGKYVPVGAVTSQLVTLDILATTLGSDATLHPPKIFLYLNYKI